MVINQFNESIRRNRNSAKESQKKKREALEKIGPLQDQYEKMQKKVLKYFYLGKLIGI